MEKILIVIPAYNEEANILKTYKTIINYCKRKKLKYDIVVINDGSTDDTQLIIEKNKIPSINLIHNLGIGGAVQTGYKYAYQNNYDIAVQFDGDGQHDVRYIENIVEPIRKNEANMVIGSRFVDKNIDGFKSTKARRIGINLISWLINITCKKKIYDTTSGFRACDRKCMEEFIQNYPVEYPEPISTVEILKKGYKVEEVPVKMGEREGGVSSIKTWKKAYYMINVFLSIIIGTRR